ncbi:MAG: putative phosphatase [Parcubacteria group bacterium GW2011_GWA2_40_23]|nr:MAG: putative phosphatase [Parcubacteria group bacterium GW2011_GWA2_40_23]
MLKAIIFDYDGVIVDSFISVFEVYEKICKRFDVAYPKTLEEFRKLYGYNYKELQKNLGIDEKDADEVGKIFSVEIVKKKHGTFLGIVDVIKELSHKYKIFLVSAAMSAEILPRIEEFGLKNVFEKFYCGWDQKIKKSDLMKSIFSEYNYTPDELVAIGDRAIDYDAAKTAGFNDNHLIMVNYGWGLDKKAIGQALVAETPHDIVGLVQFIDKNN